MSCISASRDFSLIGSVDPALPFPVWEVRKVMGGGDRGVRETEGVPLAGWAVGAKKEKGRRRAGGCGLWAVDGFEVRCLLRRSRSLPGRELVDHAR